EEREGVGLNPPPFLPTSVTALVLVHPTGTKPLSSRLQQSSIFYCENSALDHAATEAGPSNTVYEEIADHFSDTRHKPWPNVLSFVQSLPPGALLVDVGCGNGKYFGHNSAIYEVGCDSSFGLAQVCRERGFQVFNCNCLALPLRSGIADGCISIAVIHHLATKERRSRALREIVRTLRFGGKALIYVWAKDQERHKNKSAYLKQDRKNRRAEVLEGFQNNNQPSYARELSCVINKTDTTVENAACSKRTNIDPDNSPNIYSDNPGNLSFPSIPIHTNRTQFQHQDVLVPWKLKPVKESKTDEKVQTFYRFYHVFEEGELEQLCHDIPECQVTKSYYDQGNWCIVVEKIQVENTCILLPVQYTNQDYNHDLPFIGTLVQHKSDALYNAATE
ncbi:unnamed protein product, partial [Timema podura]|nr:unnamed protein product [Timema podura]